MVFAVLRQLELHILSYCHAKVRERGKAEPRRCWIFLTTFFAQKLYGLFVFGWKMNESFGCTKFGQPSSTYYKIISFIKFIKCLKHYTSSKWEKMKLQFFFKLAILLSVAGRIWRQIDFRKRLKLKKTRKRKKISKDNFIK